MSLGYASDTRSDDFAGSNGQGIDKAAGRMRCRRKKKQATYSVQYMHLFHWHPNGKGPADRTARARTARARSAGGRQLRRYRIDDTTHVPASHQSAGNPIGPFSMWRGGKALCQVAVCLTLCTLLVPTTHTNLLFLSQVSCIFHILTICLLSPSKTTLHAVPIAPLL